MAERVAVPTPEDEPMGSFLRYEVAPPGSYCCWRFMSVGSPDRSCYRPAAWIRVNRHWSWSFGGWSSRGRGREMDRGPHQAPGEEHVPLCDEHFAEDQRCAVGESGADYWGWQRAHRTKEPTDA